MAVTGIQITVQALKNTVRASFVGIGKCTSTYFEGDAYVCQLVCISCREVVISRKELKRLITA